MERSNDIDYLRIAYTLAAKESPDLSTQNGAIIVDPKNGKILAYGVNTFPKGVNLTLERLRRPDKYLFTEHAERNAIYDAARRGVKTEGMTMYCNWSACADCGRAIILSGIKILVSHGGLPEHNSPDWQMSLRAASDMFNEAGVIHKIITGKVGGVEIRFDGRLIQP